MAFRGKRFMILLTKVGVIVVAFDFVTMLLRQPAHNTRSVVMYRQPLYSKRQPKVVLITGAAGFIGYHLAKNLSRSDPMIKIVGIDNFNDYYDVQLKIDRAYDLHQENVWMYHADLQDVHFLDQLFIQFNFTHVVHLGAQAGVRYSLTNPLTYVDSNIEGHQAILDVITRHNGSDIHLTYASSSSVYGKDSPVPFRLFADVNRPGNMYAATKRASEILALRHCHVTGVNSVGLRFFTVYGPWGRPDMAVYKFAESILEGNKVPMFHQNGSAPLGRDFTYIDDIIDGVIRTMDYKPARCGIVFNLGYGNPVSVLRLVKILEKELGQAADVQLLPLPPTEILQTFADISVSRQHLGFRPTTSLAEGIKKFVAWYKPYRKRRQDPKNLKTNDALQWFRSIQEQRRLRTQRGTFA